MHRAHAGRIAGWALALAILAPASRGFAQGRPFSLDELVEFVRAGVIAESRMVTLVGERCVAFEVTDESLARLRLAGARDPLLAAVRRACRVLPGEPRWIRIAPLEVDVTVGRTVLLEATALAPDSSAIENALIRWSSSDSSVVGVRADGTLHARAPGVARVTARGTNGMESEPATVLVTPPRLERKSTTTAILLGILVPGGGQFYTGHGLKGALLFAGAVATAVTGFVVTSEDVGLVGPLPPGCSGDCTYTVNFEKKRPAVIPTLIAAGGLWAYGVVDAALQAKATQEARGPAPRLELFGHGTVAPDGTVTVPLVRIVF